jgi:phosphatidylinositol 4-kinase
LESIVSRGDVHDTEDHHQAEVELAAQEIAQLLKPLALLVSSKPKVDTEGTSEDEDISTLFREAWFNMAVHGITLQSTLGQNHYQELRLLAMNSEPLIAGEHADQLETDVDLNTILGRGMNAHYTAVQKKRLLQVIPSREPDIRRLSYPKVIFLIATYTVESLRAESGDCAKVLTYVQDPSLKQSDMGNCMVSIAERVVGIFVERALSARYEEFSAPYIAKQLAQIFARCCHRIEKVQQLAASSADRIITQTPSALCQKSSLFALLELLSMMWSSCLEADLEEYDWRSTFTSARGKVTVELSDDYALRRRTLNTFYRRAKDWVMAVMSIAPLDVKGLLQTYLSEYDDEGAYGHVSLGRSFALEMGSVIPSGDQRLRALDQHGEWPINVGSDFIAQYTTRQEYRYADALPEHDSEWLNFMHMNGSNNDHASKPTQIAEDAQSVLTQLESRTRHGKFVSIGELRDVLRRAAALLCRSKNPQCAIVHHLVAIPFVVFTKQSIKLGISLWLGVIHENPRMEPRIVTEVAQEWEKSIRRRIGIFSKSFMLVNPHFPSQSSNDSDFVFSHVDPFYLKEEFAPSDKETLHKRQQATHNLIAPHSRILQFLSSHFNAIRLGSKHTQKTYVRLAGATLLGLAETSSHPLAREFHFHVILFSLKVLRYSTSLDRSSLWQLKDRILSTALNWFQHPPRYASDILSLFTWLLMKKVVVWGQSFADQSRSPAST